MIVLRSTFSNIFAKFGNKLIELILLESCLLSNRSLCLAIIWVTDKFRPYLETRRFELFIENTALTWLHRAKDNNSILTRWSLQLSNLDRKITLVVTINQTIVKYFLNKFSSLSTIIHVVVYYSRYFKKKENLDQSP